MKYPVVLAHGIAAKDHRFFWGRIPERLEQAGVRVFMGNTDSWGTYESNAVALGETVDRVLEQCGCEKVNIIAHSKGGIDARHMISSLGYAARVASLTTVSTPHLGAEIVDYIIDRKSIDSPASKKIVNLVMRLYGDLHPDPYRIAEELSTKNMAAFNLANPDDPGIYYSSYHSVMRSSFDDMSLFFTYSYLKKRAGANDGVVSLLSARWGESFSLIKGMGGRGISHMEIVDLKRRKISGVDIPGVYVGIAERLAGMGF